MTWLLDTVSSWNINIIASYLWQNVTLQTFVQFVIFYFVVIWISLIVWVGRDISNRTNSIFLQVISILIILFLTPLGIFAYFLIRPWKTLFEKYYAEIEGNLDILAESITNNLVICPSCWTQVNLHFKNCPNCSFELQKECQDCKKLIFHEWNICPYCGKKQEKEKPVKKGKIEKKKEEKFVKKEIK